ncbi:hypothetical protein ACWD04_05030 [Streptomyces sp. NPDC002911]
MTIRVLLADDQALLRATFRDRPARRHRLPERVGPTASVRGLKAFSVR